MGYGGKDYGYSEAGYGYGVSAFTGFDGLSIIPDTLGWWSVARRVLSRYTGPIIRLRRSSDSDEQDFYGIGPQGEVSTAELRAWNGWNLLGRTENFADASWVKTGLNTISASVETPPIAGLAVFLMTEDTSTGGHNVLQNFASFAALTQVTFSVYAKAAGRSVVVLRCAGSERTFTLTGSGSVSGGAGGSIQSLGNGWYRLSNTQTIPDTATRDYTIRLHDGIGTSYTGDGTSGILLGGVQLEAASTATTYEPRTTTGAGSSFLVTLYDQSGLARHFTQSTTTLQPIICEQGVPVTENGRLAAKFVAADARRMSIAGSTAMFNALHTTGGSILLVSKANDTAAAKQILRNYNSSTGSGFELRRATTERFDFFAQRIGGAVPSAGQSIAVNTSDGASTSQSVAAFLIDPDNATAASRFFAWQNGTSLTGANAQTGDPAQENAQANLTLGASPAGAEAHDGPISELALFSSLISTADRTAWQSRSGNFFTVTIA